MRLCRLTRCPRRTCTSPCAGACAARCPSRTGIAEAMGSRGAAPCSMSWATMRQRARAADCWPAAPPCLNWYVAREGLGPEGRVVPQHGSFKARSLPSQTASRAFLFSQTGPYRWPGLRQGCCCFFFFFGGRATSFCGGRKPYFCLPGLNGAAQT